MLGTTEIIIIAAVILLLFGGTQIPKLMRGIGQGVHAYKKGLADGPDEEKKEDVKKDEKKEDVKKDEKQEEIKDEAEK